VYAVKVSGAVVPVRLLFGYADDGSSAGAAPWTCQNIKTGRRVTVRGAARFRHELRATSADVLRATGREYEPVPGTYAAWSEATAKGA
jgi:hypothetical protein